MWNFVKKAGAIIGGIALALGAFALLLWKQFTSGRALGQAEGKRDEELEQLEEATDEQLHDDLTEFR